MSEPSYLAIDPGEGVKGKGQGGTGWATFDKEGNLIEHAQVLTEDLEDFLILMVKPTLLHIIVEDYMNHGHMQQKKWSRNQTSKHIGKIEMAAKFAGVPVSLQRNTCKAIGYKWAGITPATNHAISHSMDAYAHGVYWLQINGIRPVGKALLEHERNNE